MGGTGAAVGWVVVGTGRVGTALGGWLRAAGLGPTAVVSRRGVARWRHRLRRQTPGKVLLAIPDDALAPLAAELAPLRDSWKGWCFLHTSGARGAEVLRPLGERGAAVGSLHPMMTFSKGVAPSAKGLVFSYEGSPRSLREAAGLIRAWGGRPLPLPVRVKTAYHLAATLVGPGAVVNMAAARHLLLGAGLRGRRLETALAGLRALLAATAGNLEAGLAAAWTGPAARGDWATLELHRRALRSTPLLALYEAQLAAARRLLPPGLGK